MEREKESKEEEEKRETNNWEKEKGSEELGGWGEVGGAREGTEGRVI